MRRTRTKLAIALLVVATIGATSAMASDGQFSDVPTEGSGSFAHDPAEWAAANGLTTGCNKESGEAIADTFCPNDGVTRGENITFTYRHHTVLIEPLLAAIESDVADNATAAAAAQTAADAAQTTADAAQTTADDAHTDAAAAQTAADAAQADADAALAGLPTTYFVHVAADGTVHPDSSAGATVTLVEVDPLGTTNDWFYVDFGAEADVNGCEWSATVGDYKQGENLFVPVTVHRGFTTLRSAYQLNSLFLFYELDESSIEVRTYNEAGFLFPISFNLWVTCHP